MPALPEQYSVPQEAESIWHHEILENKLTSKHLPKDLATLAKYIRFEGEQKPSIPMPWRWAESISAIKALEATLLNRLLQQKYRMDPVEITINTDHAALFVFGTALAQIVDEVQNGARASETLPLDPDTLVRSTVQNKKESQYRLLATNIYKTKDGRFYHTHGSLNATPTLTALQLPLDADSSEAIDDSITRIQDKVIQLDSEVLDQLMNEEYRQAGTIAHTCEEYLSSPQGAACSNVGLYEIVKYANSTQSPAWWPDNNSMPASAKRPLAGLKVVDLTRVIAGPTITRSLAELGASVMRVTSPNLPDQLNVHRDLNWGKWNCHLDLRHSADKAKLKQLILQADVVVDGYRPGAMARHGFGRNEVFEMVRERPRGIIYVRENCYGWHGPWKHRSGWQGISDACCGVSLEYGKAMGIDEAVTPPFPNSDHCTGAIGSAAVLHALTLRGEEGGSYGIDLALNYYSQWLVRSCGTYPESVWTDLWKRHGKQVFRHSDNTRKTVPALVKLLWEYDQDTLLKSEYFANFWSEAIQANVHRVRPVAQFKDQIVELRYNVGTRGNGVDEPKWPDDLTTEIIL